MISVIVYGRNDAHGYNLHKRVALSLNNLGGLLQAEGDEIVYVDYNTPNLRPTLVESLWDTLTEAARRRLRVLRVRPEFHTRYHGLTHLKVVEPVARNIGLRRSNPANRWVLSTNTDVVLIPRDPKTTFSDLLELVPHGFYHLPRYEVPEAIWDLLPRTQPVEAVETLRWWSTRAGLSQVATGFYDDHYDACGDFQLGLREDFLAIGGYDERMLLGWHCDSNLARRMRLHRGEVLSAYRWLEAYHLGHSREPGVYAGNTARNDERYFVADVRGPTVPGQDDRWGAPGEVVEEVRIGDFAGGVRTNDVRLGDRGVLAQLCSLLAPLPRGWSVWVEGEVWLREGVRAFWGGLATEMAEARVVIWGSPKEEEVRRLIVEERLRPVETRRLLVFVDAPYVEQPWLCRPPAVTRLRYGYVT